jgi:hypothetical protein
MSNSNFYLGQDPEQSLGGAPRFFYGLRKNENGSIFLVRSDQIKGRDSIEVNIPGEDIGNYNDFENGVDFYEGIDINHNTVFENLKYQQYRWDDRPVFYYIDAEGQLVVKINNGHNYNDLDSED